LIDSHLMHTENIVLLATSPGLCHSVQVQRFGTRDATPKVYIQGALHADEVPAILVTQQLSQRLTQLEQEGAIVGEVVLVPFANPIGLAQHSLGQHQGRFDFRDGLNFNRGHADLVPAVVDALRDSLTPDATVNTRLIRSALKAAADVLPASSTTQDLKNQLLRLAVDADIVLDLHCDTDAVMHVYALTPQAATAEVAGCHLGRAGRATCHGVW
jgi:predicted deacylase